MGLKRAFRLLLIGCLLMVIKLSREAMRLVNRRFDAWKHRERRRETTALWRIVNRERLLQYYKERKKDPIVKQYYAELERRPERRIYLQGWARKNKERTSIYRKRWYRGQDKPQLWIRMRPYNQLRKARKRGASSGTVVRYDDIFIRDRGLCQICKNPVIENGSLDHIIPLSLGGVHTEWNLQLAHNLCNTKRGVGAIPAQLRLPLEAEWIRQSIGSLQRL